MLVVDTIDVADVIGVLVVLDGLGGLRRGCRFHLFDAHSVIVSIVVGVDGVTVSLIFSIHFHHLILSLHQRVHHLNQSVDEHRLNRKVAVHPLHLRFEQWHHSESPCSSSLQMDLAHI